jgi:hypothetical protein
LYFYTNDFKNRHVNLFPERRNMGLTNGTATPFEDTLNDSEKEVGQAEDTLGEYNMLSRDELQKISEDTSPEGIERLQLLADQYDVPFEGHTPQQIIERIASIQDSQDASYMFNGTE